MPLRTVFLRVVWVSALLMAASCVSASAQAGSNAPADLQALEDELVRAAPRGMRVEMSGHVNRSLMAWDDGKQGDIFFADNDNSSSRARLRAAGAVAPGLTATAFIELEFESASTFTISQSDDDGGPSSPGVRHASISLRSAEYGGVTLGLTAPATYIMMIPLILKTPVANYADPLAGGAFALRRADRDGAPSLLPVTRRQLRAGLDTSRQDVIRYTSPAFAGCYAEAAFGENDLWDAGLWCRNDTGAFQTLVAAGYLENSQGPADIADIKGQLTLKHKPTGLFAHATAIHRAFDGGALSPVRGRERGDQYYYYLQGGIERAWWAGGLTSLFVEYGVYSDFAAGLAADDFGEPGGEVTGSEVAIWGLGVVQQIEAVAAEAYLTYRLETSEIDVIAGAGGAVAAPLEDFGYALGGVRLKF